jgi:hypothetical protein
MAQEIIKPLDTRSETTVVFTVSLVILVVALVVILLRRESGIERYMLPYQISAFSDLGSDAQAIYQDLYAAGLEIDAIHDERSEGWPSIIELEEEFMAPFVRDRAWAERGRMHWTLVTVSRSRQHAAAYFGRAQETESVGSLLLIFNHRHKDDDIGAIAALLEEASHIDIWYDATGELTFRGEYEDGNLIASGWKEVLPYKGDDEISRLKRED